ncbi:chitobiase/beta-hexosaminidase C-terminal domain-containing protein [Patescibacteria group bacterium]|nr:chitobiase/beta-hexosaminidase C-terminal domain-containing protein [Patescibacteria group bacterium]
MFVFLVCSFLYGQLTNAAAYDWKQLASSPFGNSYFIIPMMEYNGLLHAGTHTGAAVVWSSADGITWSQLNTANFPVIDPLTGGDNIGVRSLEEYGGYLYVGTCVDVVGAKVYRTQGVGGPPYTDWAKVNTDGFGDPSNNCVYKLEEFDGFLYAATRSAGAGAEIWRTNDGTTWNAVVADEVDANATGSDENGFNNANNSAVYSLLSWGGNLYAATYNVATGTEVWRTADGTTWTSANASGFGDAANESTSALVEYDGLLYAGIDNSTGGSQLHRSPDGTSWTPVEVGGFGDANNVGIYSAIEYRSELFVSTFNITTGTEIWKTGDGATWSQVNHDDFTPAAVSNDNISINALTILGDTLYAGVRNTPNACEIRAESPSTTTTVTGAQSTNGDGKVAIGFTVDDAEDADEVQARVEYNVGSGWQKATLSAIDLETSSTAPVDPKVINSNYYQVGDTTGYIDTSTGANIISTIWESQTDEPTADTASALVRVVAYDNISEGDYAQSAAFDLDNVVPVLTANPPGGTYSSAQSVTITANESPVSIYCTDDGSTPTTASTCSIPVPITALGTTELKFFGTDDKGNQSGVSTETYIITSVPPSITLTKTSTASAAPAKIAASSDNRQIVAAGNLLGKIGGVFAGSFNNQRGALKFKLVEVNLLILTFSWLVIFFILKLPWSQQSSVRLPIPRFIVLILFVLSLSSLTTLSVLSNAKQTSAAASDVNPGNYITYRLDYSNVGGDDAYNIYITDAVPAYTTYHPNSLDLNGTKKTDALDADEADYNGTNAGKVTFQVGTVTVGSSGYVSFQVKVNDNAPMGAIISNQGVGAFNPGNVAFQSNTTQNTVIATGLISGFVFYDADNNGTRDSSDFGISGANVKLYEDVDMNGVLDISKDYLVHTKSSASNGSYTFTGLSARYYLLYVDGLHSSYQLTTGNMPGQVVLTTSVQQYNNANFGYYVQPQLPVTPPIVGGKKSDSDSSTDDYTDVVISRLPVDKVSSYIEDFVTTKTDEEEKEPEKEKRPDQLEESNDLRRPQEKKVGKEYPIIVQEVLSWWDRFKDVNRKYLAPILFLLALLNFLLGVPLSILLSYLHYLAQFFTEPLLYLSRKKKREWGVVYDSLTKQPLDLAIVRLFDQETNKLVETRVTDAAGRFLFIVEPEKSYYVTADKPFYTFPSHYLEGKKADADYYNLYYGQLISAATDKDIEKTGQVAVNIPLDPQEGYVFNQAHPRRPLKTPIRNLRDAATLPAQRIAREDHRILHSVWWRRVNQVTAYIGPILGLVTFVITPNLLTFTFLVLHIILLILFHRLALGKSAKPWGKVYNVTNKKSLSRSVVRLFDNKYGKLLLTTVSKSDGRYGFLVGQETYSLSPFKEGYQFPPQKVEIVGTEEQVVRKDLGMEKADTNDTNS